MAVGNAATEDENAGATVGEGVWHPRRTAFSGEGGIYMVSPVSYGISRRLCGFHLGIGLGTQRLSLFAVELKGGQTHNLEVAVGQLQSGLTLLANLFEGQPVAHVYGLLLYRGKDPAAALADKRVDFNNQRYRVMAYPCGCRLAAILKSVTKPPGPRIQLRGSFRRGRMAPPNTGS